MTIYFIQMERSGFIKVGFTASLAENRMAQLQTGQPDKLRLLGTIPGSQTDEKSLHKELHQHRVNGEWFDPKIIVIVNHLIEKQGPWYLCRELTLLQKIMELEWVECFSKSEIDFDPISITPQELYQALRSMKGLNKAKKKIKERYGYEIRNKSHDIYNITNWLNKNQKQAIAYIDSYGA